MPPWVECPRLDLDLDVPVARRFQNLPPAALAAGRRLLAAISAEIPKAAWVLADAVRWRTGNRFQAEAVALAETIGAGWRDVMMANLLYDLALGSIGCSTIALPTPDGPVVARNMDFWPEAVLAQTSYVIQSRRAGQVAFINAGWPGAMGVVTGLSQRGFAIVLNAVLCKEGTAWTGYPVLLVMRRVLEEAAGFDDALRMLSKQTLTTAALFTLVGTENHQRVVIERSPKRHALRRVDDDAPLITTNDYRVLEPPQTSDSLEIYRTTCSRYDALSIFFRRRLGDRAIADEELLYILADPQVRQTITAQHIILRPRERTVRMWAPRDLL